MRHQQDLQEPMHEVRWQQSFGKAVQQVVRCGVVRCLAAGLLTFFQGRVQGQECPATVVDVDGNVYPVAALGGRCWTTENLRVGHYRNGWPIMSNLTDFEWDHALIGAFLDVDPWGAGYGKLYNWYAVADQRGICPVGWSIPSNADWDALVDDLGGADVASDALRSTEGWMAPDPGATNASGFSAKPAGFRRWSFGGDHLATGTGALFWTSTSSSDLDAWVRVLYRLPAVHMYSVDDMFTLHKNAMSCRCVEDVTTGVSGHLRSEPLIAYPNPVSDRLMVTWEHGLPAMLQMIDPAGRVVLQGPLLGHMSDVQVKGLPAGMYMLRVSGSMESASVRVVIVDH